MRGPRAVASLAAAATLFVAPAVATAATSTAATQTAATPTPTAAGNGQPPPAVMAFQSPICPTAPAPPQEACAAKPANRPVVPTNLAHLAVAATVAPAAGNPPTMITGTPALAIEAGPGIPVPPQPPANACSADAGDPGWTCRWPGPLEALFHYNGTYTLTLTASTCYVFFGHCTGTPTDAQATIEFGVALPPATPKLDSATVDPAKDTVTLTWSRNTEPDLVAGAAYGIVRDGQAITTVAQPPSGATVSWVDTAVPAGDHTYLVLALRDGVTTNAPDTVTSGASNQSTVTVPPGPNTPNPPGATGAGGAGGAGAAGGPGSLPPERPGLVSSNIDLSRFSTLLAQARKPGHPGEPAEPDNGFQENLPFQQKESGAPALAEGGGPAVPILHINTRTLAVVLLLLVVALHGFVLRAAVRRGGLPQLSGK